jgi:hypothetical protein
MIDANCITREGVKEGAKDKCVFYAGAEQVELGWGRVSANITSFRGHQS